MTDLIIFKNIDEISKLKALNLRSVIWLSVTALTAIVVVSLLMIKYKEHQLAHLTEVYQAYHEAHDNLDMPLAIELAQQAYELGLVEYGEYSLDSAMLAFNWANLIKPQAPEKAFELYQYVLESFSRTYGRERIELHSTLVNLGDTSPSREQASNYFQQAITIAEHYNKPSLISETELHYQRKMHSAI